MARKETRYGKYEYYRKKIKNPHTGTWVPVYGKTKAERDAKVEAQKAAWAAQAASIDSPYVWEYCARWFAAASAGMSEDRKAAVRREINDNILPVIGKKRFYSDLK